MRNIFILIVLSLGLSACEAEETISDTEIYSGGKLVFQTGEILLNPETIEMVCYFEQGEDWVVSTLFNDVAANDLFRLTSENIEGEMSLVREDYTYFTATIREPLLGDAPIQLVILSGPEKTLQGISTLFGFSEVELCVD